MKKLPHIPLWIVLFALLTLVMLLGVEELGQFRLRDYEHYLEAARRLWAGASPYIGVEYFAPPWFAGVSESELACSPVPCLVSRMSVAVSHQKF
jgi:hypothetical protein